MSLKKIAIIGGDRRLSELAILYANDGIYVNTYNVSNVKANDFIFSFPTLNEALQDVDICIGPIPFSKDGINVLSEAGPPLAIDEFLSAYPTAVPLFAGSIDTEVNHKIDELGIRAFDLMDREEFAILNAIATAEGVVDIALREMPITINESLCLVLGYGRIGKTISSLLKNMGANVWVEARKPSDYAWIRSKGMNALPLSQLQNFLTYPDLIINTVPAMIMSENQIRYLHKDTLIIDVASGPGGVDFAACEQYGIKAIHALGLPGKIAPRSAALYIRYTIKNILYELNF
ncbi:MAG: dipicolinate synthase subunit DpsA [Thermoanaerobacteraceae bacterium]|nr:dipicolinate synthase subunit DpsA [Thermoanaerobacteraceae bacterium]